MCSSDLALGLQNAILFCAVLFAAGLAVALAVNEGRGRETAKEWRHTGPA